VNTQSMILPKIQTTVKITYSEHTVYDST
jgi:hypothetical protein